MDRRFERILELALSIASMAQDGDCSMDNLDGIIEDAERILEEARGLYAQVFEEPSYEEWERERQHDTDRPG